MSPRPEDDNRVVAGVDPGTDDRVGVVTTTGGRVIGQTMGFARPGGMVAQLAEDPNIYDVWRQSPRRFYSPILNGDAPPRAIMGTTVGHYVEEPAEQFETDEEYAERKRRAEQALAARHQITKLLRESGMLKTIESMPSPADETSHQLTFSCHNDTAIDLLRVLRDLAEQGGLEIELAVVARVPVVGPQRRAPRRITATIGAGDIPPTVGQAVYMRDDGTVSAQPWADAEREHDLHGIDD